MGAKQGQTQTYVNYYIYLRYCQILIVFISEFYSSFL